MRVAPSRWLGSSKVWKRARLMVPRVTRRRTRRQPLSERARCRSAALEHERRPAFDQAMPGEMEAAMAIGRENAGDVALDQSGKDEHAVIRHRRGEGRC